MHRIPLIKCRDCAEKARCVDYFERGACAFMPRLQELFNIKHEPEDLFLEHCKRILVDYQKRYTW